MAEIQLEIREQTIQRPERLNYRGRIEKAPKQYDVETVELSKNIQKFDKKPRHDPYSYNSVSLNRKKGELPVPTVNQMLSDPTYNMIGKFLGVTTHEWNQDYSKVHQIVEWARKKSGSKTTPGLVNWISGALQVVPSLGMNHRKIDQLYLYSKLQGS